MPVHLVANVVTPGLELPTTHRIKISYVKTRDDVTYIIIVIASYLKATIISGYKF